MVPNPPPFISNSMELPQNDGDSLGNLLEEYIQSIDSPNQFSDNGWFINTTQSTVITTFTSEEAGKDLLEELLETPATFDHQDEGFHGHNPQYDFVDDTNFFPETIESLFPINQLVEQDWAFGPSQGDLGSNTNSAVEEIDGVVGKEISVDNHGGDSSSILAEPVEQIAPPPHSASPIVPLPLASSHTTTAREKPSRRGRYSLQEFAKLQAEDPEKANKMLKNRELACKEKERKKLAATILEKDLEKVKTEASQLGSKFEAMQLENKKLCAEGAKLKQHQAYLQNQLAHQDEVIEKVRAKLSDLMAAAPLVVRGNKRNYRGIQELQGEVQQVQQLIAQQRLLPNGNQNLMLNNNVQKLPDDHQQQQSGRHLLLQPQQSYNFPAAAAANGASSSLANNRINSASPYYFTFP